MIRGGDSHVGFANVGRKESEAGGNSPKETIMRTAVFVNFLILIVAAFALAQVAPEAPVAPATPVAPDSGGRSGELAGRAGLRRASSGSQW